MEKSNIYLKETDEIFDIRFDYVFKAVFTRNTPASQIALSKFISHLICRDITVIAITANEPPIGNIRDRQIRFDVNCRSETDELIDVEMSLNPDPFEPVASAPLSHRTCSIIKRSFIVQEVRSLSGAETTR